MHTKALKEELMGEIQHLRNENQHLTQLNTDLGNRNELLEEIFRSLEDDTQRQEVVCRLKRGDNHQSIVEWLGQTSAMAGTPPVTQHQFDEVVKNLPQYWDMNSDPWYWMDMYSGDPRHQVGAEIEQGQKVCQHVPPSDGVDQS